MTRARLIVMLLAAALAACGNEKVNPQTIQLRRPSSVAAFRGVVFGAPDVGAYLAIANEGRDDVSIVNAGDDSPVLAPASMKTLVVPASRPEILVSAPIGDGGADLLVVVSAGESRLQLVNTWSSANRIVDEIAPVDFGDEVLAAIPIPQAAANEPRIAVALAGGRMGVATYRRADDGLAVQSDGFTVSGPLAFQPLALAAIPDDSSHADKIYAATRDGVGATPVFGVAEVDVSNGTPAFVRMLDARGPTRLVAAARLRERRSGSTDQDEKAFRDVTDTNDVPTVSRVYAVLDESGCGTGQRIDCGVAVLNPDEDLLPDVSGRMPYLAPIPLPSRPVTIAASQPPALAPSADTTSTDSQYGVDLMRLWPATGALAATAVAAVPCEDGRIYFLDLSRWKVANDLNPLSSVGASASSTSVEVRSVAGVVLGSVRLWIADASGNPLAETATADDVRKQIDVTPGYSRNETFTVGYQADLPSLTARRARVGSDGAGGIWLAMVGPGGPIRLWDPAFGVKADRVDGAGGQVPGDIVALYVADLPDGVECAGTDAPGAATGAAQVFEARAAELLAPTDAYPGGAVRLRAATSAEEPVPTPANAPGAGEAIGTWSACLANLVAKATSSSEALEGLSATIRAGGYVVSSDLSGYLGRPSPGATPFTLEYPPPSTLNEDFKSAGVPLACPLVPWPDTIAGKACDAACRDDCEKLLLARKSRRSYHLAESCPGLAGSTERTACEGRWAVVPSWLTNPDVGGPLVGFRFALQSTGDVPNEPRRGLSLRVNTSSGVSPFAAGSATGQGALAEPRGATAFDRSTIDRTKGYRFLVPYAGDFVIDTSPSIGSGDPVSIH